MLFTDFPQASSKSRSFVLSRENRTVYWRDKRRKVEVSEEVTRRKKITAFQEQFPTRHIAVLFTKLT